MPIGSVPLCQCQCDWVLRASPAEAEPVVRFARGPAARSSDGHGRATHHQSIRFREREVTRRIIIVSGHAMPCRDRWRDETGNPTAASACRPSARRLAGLCLVDREP